MGYYIETTECNFLLKKENYDEAYKALCELNKCDDLKSEVQWENEQYTKKSFAWMDADYPNNCKTVVEILEALGFEVDENDDGISYLSYDSKSGDEEHFLRVLAPFVEEGSFITWQGEEKEIWRYYYTGKEMRTQVGNISFID